MPRLTRRLTVGVAAAVSAGSWHIVSLNVECAVQPGGCDPNGGRFASETRWLAQDLTGNRAS